MGGVGLAPPVTVLYNFTLVPEGKCAKNGMFLADYFGNFLNENAKKHTIPNGALSLGENMTLRLLDL